LLLLLLQVTYLSRIPAEYGVASMMPVSIYLQKINHDDVDAALQQRVTSHARVTCL
jgi:hypothetical protein